MLLLKDHASNVDGSARGMKVASPSAQADVDEVEVGRRLDKTTWKLILPTEQLCPKNIASAVEYLIRTGNLDRTESRRRWRRIRCPHLLLNDEI